ncbi:MAG TPA: ABC transporter permease [Terriglobales bacterium]|nr:ABC transporter permease [Terriglobales bacterium]
MSLVDRTRLAAVARKEVLQLRRDPRSLILAFLLPVLLLVFFGYAISWDVTDIRMVVLDQDHGERARALLDAFRASGRFTIVGDLARSAEIGPVLDRGRARLALVIPPRFDADLGGGRVAPVQAIVDGSDANTATITIGFAQAIVQQFSAQALFATRRVRLPVTPETRIWYNEELASRNMIVPGLVAVIMMIIAGLLTSLTIAREWERGTMEQLASTPVTRLEVVLGKLLPYLGIGLVDVAACSLLGVIVFRVPFRGDVLFLMAASFAFLVGTLGLGLVISALARNQLLATQIGMIATFLPGFLLSGFMFPIDTLPFALRLITYLVPARYFLVVTRGIFLKGVGPVVLWSQGLLMVLYALAGLAFAVRNFRKVLG